MTGSAGHFDSCLTKTNSKRTCLDDIFNNDPVNDLYRDFEHQVHINYYKARGDDKEAWDNIDIFGWLDYPMQIKVNFLCRDSILAAPIVIDLACFLDLAQRSGMSATQEWLSFYFKNPMQVRNSARLDASLHVQLTNLEKGLCGLAQQASNSVAPQVIPIAAHQN